MPIPFTSSVDFKTHLELLGIEPGMAVVMHSSLISFGRLEGGTEMAYDSILERLGSTGTLIVPAFTFNLGAGDVFDPASTPSRSTGVLSEFVRTRKMATRGAQPIHSYAAVGSQKDIAERGDADISFGEGSVFQHFLERDTHWLMLGCPFERGCTYIHHVEALVGVPYREWLELPRTRLDEDGEIKSIKVRYYATRPDFESRWDPSRIEEQIAGDSRCAVVSALYGKSMFLRTQDFHAITMELLQENELILVG